MRTAELAVALITGITGQDGSYLAELLLSKGYEVHGVVRRTSSLSRSRIDHLKHVPPAARGQLGLQLHYGDLTDAGSLQRLVRAIKPTEVYNLAAQSHVGVSFDQPEYPADVDGLGTTRLLEALRNAETPFRFYQASTSELFGATPPPQNEASPFWPRSPYAVAKLYAHWMTVYYREAHDMFACNGILFNHESPRRGENSVTRKTTRGVAAFLNTGTKLRLGSLDARRDWGHARDYVEAMWLMLRQPAPSDYVIGTGISRSVRDWGDHVDLGPAYARPAEMPELLTDPGKANREVAWYPQLDFDAMVREMLESDLRTVVWSQIGMSVRCWRARLRAWRSRRRCPTRRETHGTVPQGLSPRRRKNECMGHAGRYESSPMGLAIWPADSGDRRSGLC
jgi:GDPmannose 4,6-dehydratase